MGSTPTLGISQTNGAIADCATIVSPGEWRQSFHAGLIIQKQQVQFLPPAFRSFRQSYCSRDRRHSLRGLLPLIAELEASEKVCAAIANDQGIPSESDLEDALSWAECATFQGSQKQINWAKAIAAEHVMAIALAHKQGKQVPTDAKWWIDNRDNIVVSLPI